MNLRFERTEDCIKKKVNNRWVKLPLPDGIHQIIIDKAKLLEKVPKIHNLNKDGRRLD